MLDQPLGFVAALRMLLDSWMRNAFLRNHTAHIAGVDLFVVPTIGFERLYGLVMLRLESIARRWSIWKNLFRGATSIRSFSTTRITSIRMRAPAKSPTPTSPVDRSTKPGTHFEATLSHWVSGTEMFGLLRRC
jgi:hypothetical protein